MKQILTVDTEKLFHQITNVELKEIDNLVKEIKLNKLAPHLWLNELIQQKNYNKSQIAQYFGGTNYIYEICNGSKHPSRDKLLELLFFIKASLKEIQFTLKIFKHAPLYPKDTRDLYILYAIENQFSIVDMNALLIEKGLDSF